MLDIAAALSPVDASFGAKSSRLRRYPLIAPSR